MVLAMTHEEVFAWLASRELRSYRDLPQIWYQIQLKFRDEPRPKGGVLRVREFLMKDSYSLRHRRGRAGGELREAHRCLRPHLRALRPGVLPGGERQRLHGRARRRTSTWRRRPPARTASRCATAAATRPTWSWRGRWPPTPAPGARVPRRRPRGGRHPRAADHRGGLGVPGHRSRRQLIKSLVYMAGDKPVMALVRGDHDLHENKLARYLQGRGPAGPSRRGAGGHRGGGRFRGAGGPGGAGCASSPTRACAPTGPAGPREYAAGANKPHTHLRGRGRRARLPGRVRRSARGAGGRRLPGVRRAAAPSSRSSRWATSSSWARSTRSPWAPPSSTRAAQERPIVMGSYGIGPARIAAAAVEQQHDERGIVWPKAIAPFDVHLVQVQAKDDGADRGRRASVRALSGRGLGGALGRPRRAARASSSPTPS